MTCPTVNQNKPERLPCPFCGTDTELSVSDNGVGTFWVICDNIKAEKCGCEGPYRGSEAEAITAWNRRTPPKPSL